MTRILINTDVIIDHLREIDKATQLLLQIKAKRYVGYYSPITFFPLISFDQTFLSKRKVWLQKLNCSLVANLIPLNSDVKFTDSWE